MIKKLFLTLLFCFFLTTSVWGSILDQSYSESNQGDYVQLRYTATATIKVGQTFLAGITGNLTSCKFYIQKVGSPTGNIFATLYATSGGAPTGSAIATGDNVDVSTIGSAAFEVKEFTFSTPYGISSGTTYAIMLEGDYTPSTTVHVRVGLDSSSPTYTNGATYYYGTSWTTQAWDTCFYTYVSLRRIILIQ